MEAIQNNWISEHLVAITILGPVLKILVIAAGYFIIRWMLMGLAQHLLDATRKKVAEDKMLAREARIKSLLGVLKSTISFVLAFVAIIMILAVVGINVIPLMTTASVVGLAIGIGAQKLVKDVLSGFIILVEDQYGVGDQVTIGNGTIGFFTGTVEDLGMRATWLRDEEGKLCIISNGEISQVKNNSR